MCGLPSRSESEDEEHIHLSTEVVVTVNKVPLNILLQQIHRCKSLATFQQYQAPGKGPKFGLSRTTAPPPPENTKTIKSQLKFGQIIPKNGQIII